MKREDFGKWWKANRKTLRTPKEAAFAAWNEVLSFEDLSTSKDVKNVAESLLAKWKIIKHMGIYDFLLFINDTKTFLEYMAKGEEE